MTSFFRAALAALTALTTTAALADEPRFTLETEIGAVWQERNKVQLPNDNEGDRFELTDIAGSGPWASARINANWNISGPHNLRVVLAPLYYEERGTLDEDVRFDGEQFTGGTPIEASYTFNSWRVGYSYQFYDKNDWRLWVGGTAKIRDAEIELKQDGTRASDDDIGFVPLLYLADEYRINDRWTFNFDFDGLAGGPGRAFDVGLKLNYEVSDQWRIGAGYRLLEGGADTDDVYNFAWCSTAMVSAQWRF